MEGQATLLRGFAMEKAGLSLAQLPYDGSAYRVLLRASNGDYAGVLEFYTDVAILKEFGQGLVRFPQSISDEVRFKLGAKEGNWAYYLLLRAFVLDRSGHPALEIVIDNRNGGIRHAETRFFINCEAASLNLFGRRLSAWVERSGEPMVWVACTS